MISTQFEHLSPNRGCRKLEITDLDASGGVTRGPRNAGKPGV
jgi:hypothetical protein